MDSVQSERRSTWWSRWGRDLATDPDFLMGVAWGLGLMLAYLAGEGRGQRGCRS